MAPMIKLPRPDTGRGERSCALAMFGMVPHWARDEKIARQTYNARTETVDAKPSFRNAFKRGQFCIIPAQSFYEPSYESGRPERFEISKGDGNQIGIAGIWERKGDLLSFSMLTINADGHQVMQRFHKLGDEKRMVVVLQPDQYDDWLMCPPDDAAQFWTRYPAEQLIVRASPRAIKPAA